MSINNRLQRNIVSAGLLAALAFAGQLMAADLSAKKVLLESNLAIPLLAANKSQKTYLRISLTGFDQALSEERPPLNVALVLDQSGSMDGDKIYQAKEAARLAVSKLSANDVVSIVTYDSGVNVLVPATKATDKQALYRAISRIRANGNTALFAGTSKGADEVRKFLNKESVNRVVLLSDGIANVGPDTPSELGQLGRALAKEGMSVSTIGLGLGYNEDLMTQLANYSDGNHEFVENSADLARVFDREFGDAMSVIAQDVEIKIICDKGIKPLRIIGRDGEIFKNKVTTRMNQLYSSQKNYVVLEVEVPADQAGKQRSVADVQVTYNNMSTLKSDTLNDQVQVSFSNSPKAIKASINKEVYEDVIEQVANQQSEEAVILRDKGDIKAAAVKLESNAVFLEEAAELVSSPKLRSQSQESLYDAKAVVESKNWNKARKELKAKTYKRAKQQVK